MWPTFEAEKLCWDWSVGVLSRPHRLGPTIHVSHLHLSKLALTAPLGYTPEHEHVVRQALLLLDSTIKNQLPVPSLLTAQTPFPIELHRSNKAYSLLVHIKLPTREVQMEKSLSLGKRVEFGIRGLWIRRLDTGLHISSRTSIPTF